MYIKRQKQPGKKMLFCIAWRAEPLFNPGYFKSTQQQSRNQQPIKSQIKSETNSSSTAFPRVCPSTSKSRSQRALAHGKARDWLCSQRPESWQQLPASCPLGSSQPQLSLPSPLAAGLVTNHKA